LVSFQNEQNEELLNQTLTFFKPTLTARAHGQQALKLQWNFLPQNKCSQLGVTCHNFPPSNSSAPGMVLRVSHRRQGEQLVE